MNRTDRLYAIVEELRFADDAGRSSAWLAERFEVATRTIKRDIAALQQTGAPIWSEPGPGGGYRLLASSTALPPMTFTSGEAAAIAVALRTQTDLPFAAAGSAALTKVLGAMSTDAKRATGEILRRVWTTTRPVRTKAAKTLDVAIARQRVASITYGDRDGTRTVRKVDPIHFAHTGGRWYLLAYCHTRKDGRWFRLDRIRAARLTAAKAADHAIEDVIGRPPPEARALALD